MTQCPQRLHMHASHSSDGQEGREGIYMSEVMCDEGGDVILV